MRFLLTIILSLALVQSCWSIAIAQHANHTMAGHDIWPPKELPPLKSIPANIVKQLKTSIVVSGNNGAAQQYFDYGLAALHSFAYMEAYRSFDQALVLQPGLAMAYWGKAYSLLGVGKTGPALDKLIQSAIKAAKDSNKVERSYITALAAYTRGDDDYISALEGLIETHPKELDAKLLLAFFMNHGYDRQGQPKGRQAYAKAILEPLLNQHPKHIGVHHYWIHANEGGRYPKRALASAKVLENAKSHFAHIVHMPGHIAWLGGDYQEAVRHFRASESADIAYMQLTGISAHDYWSYNHNMAYLIVAEIEMGDVATADKTLSRVKENYLRSNTKQANHSWHNFLANFGTRLTRRSGNWLGTSELLKSLPTSNLGQRVQLLHSTALSVLNHKKSELTGDHRSNAKSALAELEILIESDTAANTNPYYQMLLAEARSVIAAMQGQGSEAIKGFSLAMKYENDISYEEPPLRVRSIRETAGQTFCHFGSYSAGASLYEDALELTPTNGFAILGLIECMRNKGDTEALQKYQGLLTEIWLKK